MRTARGGYKLFLRFKLKKDVRDLGSGRRSRTLDGRRADSEPAEVTGGNLRFDRTLSPVSFRWPVNGTYPCYSLQSNLFGSSGGSFHDPIR